MIEQQSAETSNPTLHEVFSVRATNEVEAYLLDIDVTDTDNARFRCIYMSRPNDPYGINPKLRQWLHEHAGQYEVLPYEPPSEPTIDELRAMMPALTRRRFFLCFNALGKSKADIQFFINAMTNDQQRDIAQIEFDESTTFDRLHDLVVQLIPGLGLTVEQVDDFWMQFSTV